MGVRGSSDHPRGRHKDINGKTELRFVADGNAMAVTCCKICIIVSYMVIVC